MRSVRLLLACLGVEPPSKLRAFLLLRYTLIIATAYLLLAEQQFAGLSPLAGLLIALALASNVVVARLPRQVTESVRFATAVIVCDTAWVTAALMSSGRFNADFFLLYFFLLLLAAIGENLRLIAIGAAVVCAAYLFGHSATGAGWGTWTSPSLVRIPFLFTTAVFYGYMVERTRQESRRADSAEALAAQLSRALAEFKVLYAKAQEAERIKTEFLATVSHELRTPLTSLIGYVELLIDHNYGPVTADQYGALGRVRAAGRILQRAIGRMLDASRIDCGHERLRCDEFDLNEVFDDLRGEIKPLPDVAVQWPRAEDLPLLRTDREKLRTVVRNLIENACKYTARGLIRVEGRWEGGRDEIEVSVFDTGIGIPLSEREAIFEAFRQGGNHGDLRGSGVGLGLYIVRRLVTRLGGEVSVDSQLGMGSTFTVRIPRLLHRGDAVAASAPMNRSFRKPVRPSPDESVSQSAGSR
jgi:signal transduction histidine kinase